MVPRALEEPSVVAAATHMAKGTRKTGGINADSDEPIMIGQIQLVDLDDPFAAKEKITSKKEEIINLANEQDPLLVKYGVGCKNIEVRVLESATGPMVITHLLVDCRDAMGANAVNTMAEAVAPRLETITGGRVYLRIISNLAIYRKTRASAVWPAKFLGGEEVVDGIIEALEQIGVNVPVVVRLEGTNAKEAKSILDQSGLSIIAADDMRDAAEKVVMVATKS